jgi:2-phospho-L-lactate guanylyltransferase
MAVPRLDRVRWTVVIPAKTLDGAKSRLAPASADPASHRRLVQAIRADTLAAARATPGVARVLLVSDGPGEPGALVQTRPGLNAALTEAAAHAARSWPDDGVAALVGDLPALRPDALAAALRAAGEHARSFVPDATGTRTTLLATRPGTELRPAFGPGSAARHGRDAVELPGGPSLRQDVDTAADLSSAAQLGLGPATTAVLAGAPGQFTLARHDDTHEQRDDQRAVDGSDRFGTGRRPARGA